MSGSYGDPLPMPPLDQHLERLRMRTVAAISVLGGFGIRIPRSRVIRDRPTKRCGFCGAKKFDGPCPSCKREEKPQCQES